MAITAFATVSDLLAGWPNKTFSTAEETAASALLLRATAYLTAKLQAKGIEIDDTDEIQVYNLMTVTCNMVRRSMSSGDVDGVSSMQQTIGSTTASVQWSNPSGGFWLSAMDKEILGISGAAGRAGWSNLDYVPDTTTTTTTTTTGGE